jgi:Trk K+ transport system NAD-binding subunit
MTPEVHYYWRPGCPFCSMLRRGLDKRGIATVDHNIWEDSEAAAVVRSHARGNETVLGPNDHIVVAGHPADVERFAGVKSG